MRKLRVLLKEGNDNEMNANETLVQNRLLSWDSESSNIFK